MICVGMDIGSRAIKIVLLDADALTVKEAGVVAQGVGQAKLTMQLFDRLIDHNGVRREEIVYIVATGYGRNNIDQADSTITEITCHAAGVRHVVPQVRTVIDIGGQDSKYIHLNENGAVRDFAMNDRCAAGTGCFLEVVAKRLGVELNELGQLALESTKPAIISSMCVVFAETEIIGLLAEGAAPQDIAAGVQKSIASRIVSMAGRRITPPVVFTGGVALIHGMDKTLQSTLGQSVTVAPDPQFTGALGAALLAAKQWKNENT